MKKEPGTFTIQCSNYSPDKNIHQFKDGVCAHCKVSEHEIGQNQELINKLLYDSNFQYKGLEETIQWTLVPDEQLTWLINNFPEQTLMRFTIIQKGYITNYSLLMKVVDVYINRGCATVDAIIKLGPEFLPLEEVMSLFFKKYLFRGEPYYALGTLKNIVNKYYGERYTKYTPLIEPILEQLKKTETERHTHNQGGGESRH